jgi:D-alanine-D-alanine ligase
LVERKPDLVFSGVKFFNFGKEKIWLNDFLEAYDIPYIGSDTTSLNNESNKDKAKKNCTKGQG